ncbi:nuclear control of ATP synthase 2, partial [Cylindrobasidium torrendii FP15055 ss-10]
PKLVLAPPIILSLIRSAYASREDLFDMALEAHDTVKAFVRGWLLEPVKDILNTVRTGAGEGMIVHKEGVTADLDSLERMSLSLAKDHLNYSDVQLRELSAQVKVGDITPVLKLYEQDIRAPVKSAMTGTLLRTLFIQIQKAKVDIDQALFGIDKLLKSQELTFAFVGVAPAFGIVYLSLGYFRGLWTSRSSGAYGGKLKRTNAWFIMRCEDQQCAHHHALIMVARRIERLLTLDATTGDGKMLSTRAAGLLLVSVAHLQSYAEKHLPKRSRLREGFLQDVDDLSNPALTRQQKVRVVERMWRSWGHTLGWGRL